MRTFITQDPYRSQTREAYSHDTGIWPCRWIATAFAGETPFVTVYRRRFTMDQAATVRAHVTADERYELFLDGQRIGRGSERGDARNWFFETYDLPLKAGEHVLVARAWSMGTKLPFEHWKQGPQAAFAQMSVYPGFLFSPQEKEHIDLLGTGVAEWEAKKLGGYSFTDCRPAWGTGAKIIVDGAQFDWGWEKGEGAGWEKAIVMDPGVDAQEMNDYAPTHLLRPATLPPMTEEPRHVGRTRLIADIPSVDTFAIPIRAADNLAQEETAWAALLAGNAPLTVPAHTRRRVLIDLENYYCAYPEMVTSGGAGSLVRVHWQEALFNEMDAQTKDNRNEVEGKFFITRWKHANGTGDEFLPGGGTHCRFDTLWWECGRYIELVVETKDEPLTIESFLLRETRYPVECESEFSSSDTRLEIVTPIAVRGLQMCSHETYMDCPYYEQLMYIGDTRLQVLTTYAVTADSRLPKKALDMFHASRLPSGLTQSRYPSRVTQTIPPFSLWWTAMVYDWALWRGDREFVQSLMPGVRNVLDVFSELVRPDGLLGAPIGWNFTDWVPDWPFGVSPGGKDSPSGPLHWQFALALSLAAQVEDWLDEPEMAARHRRRAVALAQAAGHAFWDEKRGMYADDPAHKHFSEHSQCLALLSGLLTESQRRRVAQGLLSAPDLARTTIYYSHYLFETLYLLGRTDKLIERLDLWFGLAEMGLFTTVEMPEPTRSDCHGWGAHPAYHFMASLLGIRPQGLGFETVRIAPQLGPLVSAKGSLAHPAGAISVDLRADAGGIAGSVTLPKGMSGTFAFAGHEQPLSPGRQEIRFPPA